MPNEQPTTTNNTSFDSSHDQSPANGGPNDDINGSQTGPSSGVSNNNDQAIQNGTQNYDSTPSASMTVEYTNDEGVKALHDAFYVSSSNDSSK